MNEWNKTFLIGSKHINKSVNKRQGSQLMPLINNIRAYK